MFCSHCGKAIPEGSKFCSHCGMAQVEVPSDATPAPLAVADTSSSKPVASKKAGCIGILLWALSGIFILAALGALSQSLLAALFCLVVAGCLMLAGPNPGDLRSRLHIPSTRGATIGLYIGAVIAFFAFSAALPRTPRPSVDAASTPAAQATGATTSVTPVAVAQAAPKASSVVTERPAPTETPEPPTPTPLPDKAEAQYLDPRQLAADPTSYVGQNVWLQGQALNVMNYNEEKGLFGTTPERTWIQLLAQVQGRSTTESVVVEFFPKNPEILKDECYRIYAIVVGTQTVQRTLTGATNEVPLLRGYDWEPAERDRFGISCAPLP